MANIADKVRSVFGEASKSVLDFTEQEHKKLDHLATELKATLDEAKKRLQDKLKKAR